MNDNKVPENEMVAQLQEALGGLFAAVVAGKYAEYAENDDLGGMISFMDKIEFPYPPRASNDDIRFYFKHAVVNYLMNQFYALNRDIEKNLFEA